MKLMKNAAICCLCLMMTVALGCGDDDSSSSAAGGAAGMGGAGGEAGMGGAGGAEELPTIAQIAIDATTFTTLLAAVEAAGLTALLADASAGPFTVFAPNDDAFAAVDSAALDALIADVPALTTVLQHHVVAGKADSAAVLGSTEHTTLAETTLAVDAEAVTIGGANIITTDLEASNGYVHVIDAVLFPPAPQELPTIAQIATDAETFTTLLAAVEAAGLTGLLADATAGPFTVFAPNDDAFAEVDSAALEALLADVPGLTTVLQHHVVAGKADSAAVLGAAEHTTLAETTLAVDAEAVTIGGANIIATDLEASNGYVHVIDAVLFPPAAEELPSIAEIATDAGNFMTLLTAVETAGLTSLLADDSAGPFTVFAPNDEAFGAVDEATIEALLMDVEALTRVLQHHIVDGKADSSVVLGAAEHTTLAGTTLAVDADAVTIGGAAILAPDLEASNGYVHVIGSVLLPPER